MDIEQFAAQLQYIGITDEDLLSVLAIASYERHVQSGSTEHIDIAIGLAKQGIYRTANDDPSLIEWLNNSEFFLKAGMSGRERWRIWRRQSRPHGNLWNRC